MPIAGGIAGDTMITITGKHFTSSKANQSEVTVHLNNDCDIQSVEFGRYKIF